MKRFGILVVALAFAASACAGNAKKEAAPAAPKAAEKPALMPHQAPAPSGSDIEKQTLDACLKRNPDNEAYCRCYSNELGQRFGDKAKLGEVSVQERGQIAVQSALACKQLNKKIGNQN